MCAGCMGTADFLFTGGVLGAASLRVATRRLLPGRPARSKVTDAEADAFITRLRTGDGAAAGAEAAADDAAERAAVEGPQGAERARAVLDPA